jgi:hypothetical protein
MHALERRRGLVDVARRRHAEPVRRTLHCDRQWVNATERADARDADAPRSPASRASASSPRAPSPSCSRHVVEPDDVHPCLDTALAHTPALACRSSAHTTDSPPATDAARFVGSLRGSARAGRRRPRTQRPRARAGSRGARGTGWTRPRAKPWRAAAGAWRRRRGGRGGVTGSRKRERRHGARAPSPVDRHRQVVRHRAGVRTIAWSTMDGRRGRQMEWRGEGRRGEAGTV